ncbi:MAG: tetratricopeptide repeat protein, partial [Pyrinomonadaceae bacterium]
MREIRLPVSIRAHAPSYVAVGFLSTFFAFLAFYLDFNWIGGVVLAIALICIPVFASTDMIVFDGRRLIRTGIIPRIWFKLHGLRSFLKVRNIEQVDTVTSGSLRYGGRVRILFRTTIYGNGPRIVFAGSGARYRRMVKALFGKLDVTILDIRSFELQKYVTEPREAIRIANELQIPASDVLEGAYKKVGQRKHETLEALDPRLSDSSKAAVLRNAANRLRMSGILVRAAEAFRRALRLEPNNAWLLFEFSRCLHLLAFVRRDRRLEHRAAAALRLAEKHAANDTELVERIAETYRQFGYSRRAANAYQSVVDRISDCFRSLIGLAEIALDEGKLAHVVHNFSAANRIAGTAALRRWTSAEAEYFSKLSEDDEYMELEVSRLN